MTQFTIKLEKVIFFVRMGAGVNFRSWLYVGNIHSMVLGALLKVT